MAGLMNSLCIAVSMGLQYGVPPEVYVSKLSHMRFEPSGLTNDADIRAAKSIVDYIFRWFGKKFLTPEQQEEAGILSPEVKARLAERVRERRRRAAAAAPAEAPPPGQTALFNCVGGRRRVRPLRRPHGAHRHLLHVPRLRHEHRLQLRPRQMAKTDDPADLDPESGQFTQRRGRCGTCARRGSCLPVTKTFSEP